MNCCNTYYNNFMYYIRYKNLYYLQNEMTTTNEENTVGREKLKIEFKKIKG